MSKIYLIIASVIFMITVQRCSKKIHPAPTVINPAPPAAVSSDTKTDTSLMVKKTDSVATIKPVVKTKPKESIPKVIVVNDKYASKSVDGRYYYDLQGHRYWRNNKDGKYYLFNKSMLTDDAFKKPE